MIMFGEFLLWSPLRRRREINHVTPKIASETSQIMQSVSFSQSIVVCYDK